MIFTFITSQLKLLQNAAKVITKRGSIEKVEDFFNFKIHLVQKLNKIFALKNNENLKTKTSNQKIRNIHHFISKK